MKKILAILAALALLLGLTACKTTETDGTDGVVSTPAAAETADEPTVTMAPTETAADFSVMAGSFVQDEEGGLWTSLAEADGVTNITDVIPADVGYVYSFLVSGDKVYAVVKESAYSMDGAGLYVFDAQTGAHELLAENCSAGCGFCLVGERLFYETDGDGLWALDIPSGRLAQALPDAVELFAAHNGFFYYAKADGALYRNDSTFAAETQILEFYESFWFCSEGEGLCDLAYAEEGTVAVLEFRELDGALRTQCTLSEPPTGIYAADGVVYVPQPSAQTILMYDIATGDPLGSIPLAVDGAYCLIDNVSDGVVYYESMADGTFYLNRMNVDGTGAEQLAAIAAY